MKNPFGARSCALAASLLLACGQVQALHDEDLTADGDRAHNKNLLHDTDLPDGHVAPNVNYGFEVVGRDTLGGISDGKYTDVWAHRGYAYVGTFQEPTCDRSGVYISDIRDPANPHVVAMIKSPPGTRHNDVKVHPIGSRDVLIVSLEKCGPNVGNGNAVGGGNGGHQQGQAGISLWDVTDPARPHALKQNFLDFQVHNTFAWTTGDGKTYLMIVDDESINDVHIADISKPQAPQLIATTGIGRWLTDGEAPRVGDDGQLFMGSFATPLLHDIWVAQMPGGAWHAVLSYWDAGFITLDVSDPFNPVFLKDSTYPDPDPVHGISPPEGNAHAAVFGGPNHDKIFGGDEDFDSLFTAFSTGGADYPASQGSDVPQIGPGADVESVDGAVTYLGRACGPLDAGLSADATGGSIGLVERGDCTFAAKAGNAEAAGYSAVVIFNQPSNERDDGNGCEGTVSMLVEAGIPALFVSRSVGFAALGLGYDPALCTAAGDTNDLGSLVAGATGPEAAISAVFDGRGYFHVLNNTMDEVTVPFGQGGDTRTVGYLGEIGYYAPAEVTDPALATGAGDLTMHNVEADPLQPNRAFISWYSLGMRAVEWRPGHLHNNLLGEGVVSWNVHEVGRFIAPDGSNFWGVHVTEIDGQQYVLGSDRNTGLWIFRFSCVGEQAQNPALYCERP